MSIIIEDTRQVGSQYIRDEEVRMLRDPGLILGRLAPFFSALFNAKSDRVRLDSIEGVPQCPVTHALGVEQDRKRGNRSLEVDGEYESSGTRGTSSRTPQTRVEP